MTERVLHVTPIGQKPVLVDIAPDPPSMYPPSKRLPLIIHEDQNLDLNLIELDKGTKAKNRAFQDRLDDVWSGIAGWEAKLKKEACDAFETITSMRDEYEKHIETFTLSLLDEIKNVYNKFDDDLLPLEDRRIDKIEKDATLFVDKIVPDAIERQSGEVSRNLKKAYETFGIEKKKEEKREQKFVSKANNHIQNTAQKFTDEDALMSSCFYNLQDDIVEIERRSARMHLYKWNNNMDDVYELKKVIKELGEIRQVEDVDILDTVIETQKLLQETVLEHFGTENKQPKEMKKLNARMDKINMKKQNKESKDNAVTSSEQKVEIETTPST